MRAKKDDRTWGMKPSAPPVWAPAVLGALLLSLAGCITVKAPDKPIEINLNVKVQQEVVVRLQKDAQELITNNPELFPQ